MIYILDLRDTNVGGGLGSTVKILRNDVQVGDSENVSELVAAIHGKDLLLVTHGFNVDEEGGEVNLDDLEPLLPSASNHMMVGVLWPGDADWGPIKGAVYLFKDHDSRRSGDMLAEFINLNFNEAASLSFASHSLGARVMLETILNMNRKVHRLVVMAGAIDDNCLTKDYKGAAAKIDHISVLASRKDTVLSRIFPIGNFLAGIIGRGHPYWHAALGHAGPASPIPDKLDPIFMIPDSWEFNHGSYFPDQPVALPASCSVTGILPAPSAPGLPECTCPTAPVLSPDPCDLASIHSPWKPAWTATYIGKQL